MAAKTDHWGVLWLMGIVGASRGHRLALSSGLKPEEPAHHCSTSIDSWVPLVVVASGWLVAGELVVAGELRRCQRKFDCSMNRSRCNRSLEHYLVLWVVDLGHTLTSLVVLDNLALELVA